MKVIDYQLDKILECRFKGHHFQLERDEDTPYSFGNWYMIVTNDAGEVACDGWIPHSSSYTARRAMKYACKGALLEPPKRWPDGVR